MAIDEFILRASDASADAHFGAAAAVDGAELATDDWRAVVEHPDVSFVVVATPDRHHHEAVLACARAGKHVLCEKPVGMHSGQALEMWQACREGAFDANSITGSGA